MDEKRIADISAENVIDGGTNVSDLSREELVRLFLILADINASPDTAKLLLSRFGSPEKILSAPVTALEKIDGVGFDGAVKLSLIHTIAARAVSKSKVIRHETPQQPPEKMLKERISGLSCEAFAYLFSKKSGETSGVFVLTDEASVQISVMPGNIIENAVFLGADRVYVAHNHPSGGTVSQEDIESTQKLRQILSEYSIELVEHYIFARMGRDTPVKTYRLIKDYIDAAPS